MSFKNILSLVVYSTCTVGFLVYLSNNHSNSILSDVFTDKNKTFIQKINYFRPDYIYGRGAKSVLIQHQLESDRDECKNVYSSYINKSINKEPENQSGNK
jgi:hypothetical protein